MKRFAAKSLAANIIEATEVDEEVTSLEMQEEEFIDKTKFYATDQIKEQKTILHLILDTKLLLAKESFEGFIANKDSTGYIQMFAKIVEQAFVEFGKLEDDQVEHVSGRDKVNVKQTYIIVVDNIKVEEDDIQCNVDKQCIHLMT